MKVAAYQAPLLRSGSLEALGLIRQRVEWCEAHGVTILCCPEAILGGLADHAADPTGFAMDAQGNQLSTVLAPLASDTVTTIVGFTEMTGTGRLYNTAAVFHKGSVIGLYRKLYPAINRSIYEAGNQMPVFQVGGLTFGIVICNDSNYPEPARIMAARGATALFVPPTMASLRRRRTRISSPTRGTPTSLGRWRTACGSFVPMSWGAQPGSRPAERPESSVPTARCCSPPSNQPRICWWRSLTDKSGRPRSPSE